MNVLPIYILRLLYVFRKTNIFIFRLKYMKFSLFFFLLAFLWPQYLIAQVMPINDIKEEQIRIHQLFQGAHLSSLTSRPLWFSLYDEMLKTEDNRFGIWSENHAGPDFEIPDFPGVRVGAYTSSISFTSNTSVPYGWNNEAAWYGRGINSNITAGIWVTSRFLTLTYRPQFTMHQNLNFEVPRFVPYKNAELQFGAEAISDQIDRPFRFGNRPFNQYSHGYTSLRFHYNHLEAGLSTEPLWWGGNVNYPLLMSNNAPGMKHFFAGSRAPLALPYLGRVEFRFIGAFPEDSDYFHNDPPDSDTDPATDEENPFNLTRNRFMSGILLTYSPAFAPNFHVGWARVVHTYLEEGGLKWSDLGMVFDPILLEEFIEIRGPDDVNKPRNHLTSLFVRWVWPESRFELYGEFLRDDFSWDSRDVLMEIRHNSGYSIGFQKLIRAPYAHFYRVNLELTNLTPSYLQEVRPQNYIYGHTEIREGHTNRGQLLGAAIGPGSNSQYISIDSYQDWGRYGIFIRRLADNNHFHFEYDRLLNRPEQFRQGYGDYWRHRTDLTIGTRGLYSFGKLLIVGEFSWTKLFNYGRYDYGTFGGLNISNFEPYDTINVQVQVSFSYQF